MDIWLRQRAEETARRKAERDRLQQRAKAVEERLRGEREKAGSTEKTIWSSVEQQHRGIPDEFKTEQKVDQTLEVINLDINGETTKDRCDAERDSQDNDPLIQKQNSYPTRNAPTSPCEKCQFLKCMVTCNTRSNKQTKHDSRRLSTHSCHEQLTTIEQLHASNGQENSVPRQTWRKYLPSWDLTRIKSSHLTDREPPSPSRALTTATDAVAAAPPPPSAAAAAAAADEDAKRESVAEIGLPLSEHTKKSKSCHRPRAAHHKRRMQSQEHVSWDILNIPLSCIEVSSSIRSSTPLI